MKPQQYIDFEEVGNTGKTKLFDIMSRSGGYKLGTIKWYPNWRQYVFSAEPHTVWNVGCLRTVESYIEGLMAARKNAADDRRREAMKLGAGT